MEHREEVLWERFEVHCHIQCEQGGHRRQPEPDISGAGADHPGSVMEDKNVVQSLDIYCIILINYTKGGIQDG